MIFPESLSMIEKETKWLLQGGDRKASSLKLMESTVSKAKKENFKGDLSPGKKFLADTFGEQEDLNLPFPLNISLCNSAQIAYWHRKVETSNLLLKEMLETTALKMIDAFGRLHVVTDKEYYNIAPLATFRSFKVVTNLLNEILKKLDSDKLLSEDKMTAVACMVQYALLSENQAKKKSGKPQSEIFIDANTILIIIELVASKLNALKEDSLRLLLSGLQSLNILLDAAATLKIESVDKNKLQEINTLLEGLIDSKSNDPALNFQARYAYQAFLRISNEANDYQQVFGASFTFVNGAVQLGFAVLAQDVGVVIDSITTIAGAVAEGRKAIKLSRQPWFDSVQMMRLVCEHGHPQTFLDLIDSISRRPKSSAVSFKDEELLIGCILLVDKLIRSKKLKTVQVEMTVNGNPKKMSAREGALLLLERFYTQRLVFDPKPTTCRLILQYLYEFCSIPEIELQNAAKGTAKRLYSRKEDIGCFSFLQRIQKDDEVSPTELWPSEHLITAQPADVNFLYVMHAPNLDHHLVEEVFQREFPIEFLFE
jgi:SHS2 domain-containing protein